uniref:Uncharacterized protein n=1 Tax=Junco hyemalis TaxID=40217 RepID=A0A8C5J7K2_JUNHY
RVESLAGRASRFVDLPPSAFQRSSVGESLPGLRQGRAVPGPAPCPPAGAAVRGTPGPRARARRVGRARARRRSHGGRAARAAGAARRRHSGAGPGRAAPGVGHQQAGRWKVLRSQYSQVQDKQSRALSVTQKQESTFAAKDWCEDADDWGACDGAEAPACASLELLGLKEAVSSEVECASQLQQLHLSEPAHGPGAQDTPPAASEDMVMAVAAS